MLKRAYVCDMQILFVKCHVTVPEKWVTKLAVVSLPGVKVRFLIDNYYGKVVNPSY